MELQKITLAFNGLGAGFTMLLPAPIQAEACNGLMASGKSPSTPVTVLLSLAVIQRLSRIARSSPESPRANRGSAGHCTRLINCDRNRF
ncbi:hypothetical protein C8J56DRAFT_1172627 [Mycena floridula]|nr:hypothetical protein C8J56DRAFT_1172627 [Mycena floridula]